MKLFSRIGYILYEIGFLVVSLISRVINAVVFKGSMQQTLSARAYVMSHGEPKWEHRRKIIDTIFFWEDQHCRNAWLAEVDRARRTLYRNEALPDDAEV